MVTVDFDAHHALARRAAAAGSVLLTNDGMLPLSPKGTVAVIGAFAQTPRFQGAGSSLVNPTRVDAFLDEFRAAVGAEATVTYAPGYDAKNRRHDPRAPWQRPARRRRAPSTVVLLVGLPGALESEGFDRATLRLPDGHEALVAAVTEANSKTVVVMLNGGAVVTPWADSASRDPRGVPGRPGRRRRDRRRAARSRVSPAGGSRSRSPWRSKT